MSNKKLARNWRASYFFYHLLHIFGNDIPDKSQYLWTITQHLKGPHHRFLFLLVLIHTCNYALFVRQYRLRLPSIPIICYTTYAMAKRNAHLNVDEGNFQRTEKRLFAALDKYKKPAHYVTRQAKSTRHPPVPMKVARRTESLKKCSCSLRITKDGLFCKSLMRG